MRRNLTRSRLTRDKSKVSTLDPVYQKLCALIRNVIIQLSDFVSKFPEANLPIQTSAPAYTTIIQGHDRSRVISSLWGRINECVRTSKGT